MVILPSGATVALAALSLLGPSLAIPLVDKLKSLTPSARDLLRSSVPAAPRFVVYSDAWVSPLPSAAALKGYNVYALSFWINSGPVDMAEAWEQLTDNQRGSYLKEYNDAGISLIVSAFGSTESPTSSGTDAVAVANKLASWVLRHGLQGVDIDYEDFNAFNSQRATAEPWLVTLTRQLRTHLPQGQYILSHAPVAPWFSPGIWPGGGYLEVHKQIGYLIDWYNVQFYNQGTQEYTLCHTLLTGSSSQFPQSAVFQIAANGVDLQKIVIGKPARPQDVSNGFMDQWKFAWCVGQAHGRGWNAGVMAWEFPYAPSWWITFIRGNTF